MTWWNRSLVKAVPHPSPAFRCSWQQMCILWMKTLIYGSYVDFSAYTLLFNKTIKHHKCLYAYRMSDLQMVNYCKGWRKDNFNALRITLLHQLNLRIACVLWYCQFIKEKTHGSYKKTASVFFQVKGLIHSEMYTNAKQLPGWKRGGGCSDPFVKSKMLKGRYIYIYKGG